MGLNGLILCRLFKKSYRHIYSRSGLYVQGEASLLLFEVSFMSVPQMVLDEIHNILGGLFAIVIMMLNLKMKY